MDYMLKKKKNQNMSLVSKLGGPISKIENRFFWFGFQFLGDNQTIQELLTPTWNPNPLCEPTCLLAAQTPLDGNYFQDLSLSKA